MDRLTTRSFLELLREAVPDALVVASLGRTAVECAKAFPDSLRLDAMGCVTPVAAGVALAVDEPSFVVALDTDGSLLMELSALAVLPAVLELASERLCVVVVDNAILEASGAMPRAPAKIDWVQLVASFALRAAIFECGSAEALVRALRDNDVLIATVDNRGESEPLQPSDVTGREAAVRFRSALARETGRPQPCPAIKP